VSFVIQGIVEPAVFLDQSDLGPYEGSQVVLIDCDNTSKDFVERVYKKLMDHLDKDKSRLPIIFISSEGEESDIVWGLKCGAHDYIARPFSDSGIYNRIKAVVDRVERTFAKKIKVKDIEIDLDEHKVVKSGKIVDLTYLQFRLLFLLASRRERVFSRKEILERVWGREVYVTSRTVDVQIKRLREKLGEYKYPSQYIETIHGIGYRFL